MTDDMVPIAKDDCVCSDGPCFVLACFDIAVFATMHGEEESSADEVGPCLFSW